MAEDGPIYHVVKWSDENSKVLRVSRPSTLPSDTKTYSFDDKAGISQLTKGRIMLRDSHGYPDAW